MRKLLAICVVVALTPLFATTPAAQAQYWGSAFAGFGGYYPFYVQERVPYFAVHPPVYYSTPIARSYGHSPYAYPSTLWHVPRLRTLAVANHHVVAVPQVLASLEVTPFQPQVIKNPHVK
ncbi:MAG: hypothetical protein JNM18_15530 [Planctomycetaceae bacterium]|nr:hypothetical protein [Planctomycetaceae bacterium]